MISIAASAALILASTVSAAVHDVTVGNADAAQIYTPSSLVSASSPPIHAQDSLVYQSASAGDQIIFHFEQANHTATQSSFDDPCHTISGGFDSGL